MIILLKKKNNQNIKDGKLTNVEDIKSFIIKNSGRYSIILKYDEIELLAQKIADKNNLSIIKKPKITMTSIVKYIIEELEKLGYSKGDIVHEYDFGSILDEADENIIPFDSTDYDKSDELMTKLRQKGYDVISEDLIEGNGPGDYYEKD